MRPGAKIEALTRQDAMTSGGSLRDYRTPSKARVFLRSGRRLASSRSGRPDLVQATGVAKPVDAPARVEAEFSERGREVPHDPRGFSLTLDFTGRNLRHATLGRIDSSDKNRIRHQQTPDRMFRFMKLEPLNTRPHLNVWWNNMCPSKP